MVVTVVPGTGTYVTAAGSTATLSYPTVTATSVCGADASARALTTAANLVVGADVAQWRHDLDALTDPVRGSYAGTGSAVVNEEGLTVVAFRLDSYRGGAHGQTNLRAAAVLAPAVDALDTATMIALMQQAGGPRWNFERELVAAADAATGQHAESLTRDNLGMAYPTRAGLVVGIDQCAVYACALGAVQATIPWSVLIAPGTRMSFIPDAWGY